MRKEAKQKTLRPLIGTKGQSFRGTTQIRADLRTHLTPL